MILVAAITFGPLLANAGSYNPALGQYPPSTAVAYVQAAPPDAEQTVLTVSDLSAVYSGVVWNDGDVPVRVTGGATVSFLFSHLPSEWVWQGWLYAPGATSVWQAWAAYVGQCGIASTGACGGFVVDVAPHSSAAFLSTHAPDSTFVLTSPAGPWKRGRDGQHAVWLTPTASITWTSTAPVTVDVQVTVRAVGTVEHLDS